MHNIVCTYMIYKDTAIGVIGRFAGKNIVNNNIGLFYDVRVAGVNELSIRSNISPTNERARRCPV